MRSFFLLMVLCVTVLSSSARADGISFEGFSVLPVVYEGRVKPLDSFARTHLISFRHKDHVGDIAATAWLAELLFDQKKSYDRPVFNIPNPDVLHAVGLKYRQDHVYSFAELAPVLSNHLDVLSALSQTPVETLSLSQRQLLDLFQAVSLYYEISLSLPSSAAGNVFDVPARSFRIIPSQWGKDKGDWFSPSQLAMAGSGSPQTSDYIKIWEAMAVAYQENDSELWDEAVLAASIQIKNVAGQGLRSGALQAEYLYNRLNMFHYSLFLYVIAFLSLIASGVLKPQFIRRVGVVSMGVGAALHTIGLMMRVYIMARPPVGTLYESIIFVGLITVIFSLLLERRNRDGLGLLIGSVLGAFLHFIAMRYATDGNSMGMLSAVLNTNFWLATHVVMITIGYGCCLVTGLLGHLYLMVQVFHPQEKDKQSELARNMLGAGLVALFFCLLGTILGGIWADQSWGRFWGWDPKENGAMLICLWLIAFLHGRIAGNVGKTAFAMGMAFLTVIVALAWFGVNLLSVGLHSYGFTENIATNLFLFIGGELFFLIFVGIMLVQQNQSKEKAGTENG